jgi:hypothetical protein
METLVTALITQRNQEEAARSAGIGIATLVRWQKDPEFQKAFREARRAVHQLSVARLQQATGTAVTTLLKVWWIGHTGTGQSPGGRRGHSRDRSRSRSDLGF